MHWELHIYKITGKKINHLMILRYLPKRNKRIGNSNKNYKNIQPGYRNGIWG